MDAFKVEFFHRDRPGQLFPWFETLTAQQAEHIRRVLATRLAADATSVPSNLFVGLLAKATSVNNINVDAPSFSLISYLNTLNLSPTEFGYITWDVFNDIDRFKFQDLSTYFEDICTGYLSDDVCVFDDTLEWFLFIMHYGVTKITRFGLPNR